MKSKNRGTTGGTATAMPENESAREVARKSRLESFAEEVAASHLGLDVEKVAKACAEVDSASLLGYSSWDLIGLIELVGQIVVKILESCPDRSNEKLKAAVARPTFWQRVRVRNLVKEYFEDSPHRRWRNESGAVAQRLIECAQRAEPSRVQEILDEVRSEDNWLV